MTANDFKADSHPAADQIPPLSPFVKGGKGGIRQIISKARYVVPSLIIGLLVGAAIGWWGHRLRVDRWRGGQHYERLLERFTSRLDLTPDQRARVGSILGSKRQKVDALRSEVRPRFEDIRRATDDEIAALLTPEQRTKFEKMKARREERRRKHFMRYE